MLDTNVFKRHKKAREHYGKLCELMCAEWLEESGWKISGLEALGAKSDVIAFSPDGVECCIEVKFIGEEDDQFFKTLESISSGNAAAGAIPITNGYNYLIFRAYEAVKQLQGCNKYKIVAIFISNMTWSLLEFSIRNMLFNRPPDFIQNTKCNDFFSRKKGRYPHMVNEIRSIFYEINEIWIIKLNINLSFTMEEKKQFKNQSLND